MSGFIVDRGVWDDDVYDVFADEPFTEREAWIWLNSEAAWKPRTRRLGKYSANLERGQLIASVRFLAEAWGWSKSRVDRFLGRLKNRDMLRSESGTGILIITICNYDEIQLGGNESGTVAGQLAGQKRDSSGTNEKKSKEEERRKDIRHAKPDFPDFIRPEVASGYRAHRRAKKAPLTDRALSLLSKTLIEIKDRGGDPNAALDMAIDRGWQSLKADWYFRDMEQVNGKRTHDQSPQQRRASNALDARLAYVAGRWNGGGGAADAGADPEEREDGGDDRGSGRDASLPLLATERR